MLRIAILIALATALSSPVALADPATPIFTTAAGNTTASGASGGKTESAPHPADYR